MRNPIKAGALALVLSLSLATPAVAGPIEDSQAAFARRDYVTAMRLLRPLADQGDAFSQAMVGAMYQNGWGVPQDYAAAVSWLRKAADQGFPGAQFQLGRMYISGRGVPQDDAQAAKWTRKAADQGDANAQLMLG